MSISERSQDVKEIALALLGIYAGPLDRMKGTQSRYINHSKSICIHIAFSREDVLFYGIGPQVLNEMREFRHAFVVFIVGSIEKILVIPLHRILDIVKHLYPEADMDFKLHLKESAGGYHFAENPEIDITSYLNNLEQLRVV